MKRLLLFIILLSGITSLTSCVGNDIFVADDMINVVFENIHYEGNRLFADIYITNGFDNDEYVEYMEFDIFTSDDELYVAGAGFDIESNIPKGSYIEIEIEFVSEFVFLDQQEIEALGYSIEDLELLFWLEE